MLRSDGVLACGELNRELIPWLNVECLLSLRIDLGQVPTDSRAASPIPVRLRIALDWLLTILD